MIIKLQPEDGGRTPDVHQVVLDMPMHKSEMRALAACLDGMGFHYESEGILAYLNGEEWEL